MSFIKLKSVALYSLLAVGQGVSGRALPYDASISRREDPISLITTGKIAHFKNHRAHPSLQRIISLATSWTNV